MLPRSGRSGNALDQREYVAFAVLEPGRLGAASGIDAVLTFHAGRVIVLELDSAASQLGHFSFNVVDLPEGLAGFRRARIRRRIKEAPRAIGEFVSHSAGNLLLGLQADLLLVELASAIDVFGGNVGVEREILQHADSSNDASVDSAATAMPQRERDAARVESPRNCAASSAFVASQHRERPGIGPKAQRRVLG